MSDVSALVLSVGEDTTERAVASARRQTLRPREILVVSSRHEAKGLGTDTSFAGGVAPFHAAINLGAARVRTDFFLQVDADMILDEKCIEDLRRCVAPTVGLVVGHLRDPLQGRILGVKLFRTECFAHARFGDSISSDTDFSAEIGRHGWERIYALNRAGPTPEEWHCFGEHSPDYGAAYTYGKFLVDGARCAHRKGEGRFRRLFERLRRSRHPAAVIATIAGAHGLFFDERGDCTGTRLPRHGLEVLQRFLERPDAADAEATPCPERPATLPAVFVASCERGAALGARGRRSEFLSELERLRARDDIASFVALVGLCEGLFRSEHDREEVLALFASLREILRPVWGEEVDGPAHEPKAAVNGRKCPA